MDRRVREPPCKGIDDRDLELLCCWAGTKISLLEKCLCENWEGRGKLGQIVFQCDSDV